MEMRRAWDDVLVALACLAVVVALSLYGCGGGGGDGSNSPGGDFGGLGNTNPQAEGGSNTIHQVSCSFGDGSTVTITVTNGVANVCTEQGGTVTATPDNSSNDDNSNQHPNDQSGQTNTTKALGNGGSTMAEDFAAAHPELNPVVRPRGQ